MSLLDAHIPALVAAEGTFAAKTALMRSTISQAESAALSAQAFHVGESSVAFQAAHARFVEVAAKVTRCWISRRSTSVMPRPPMWPRMPPPPAVTSASNPSRQDTENVADYLQLPRDAGPCR
ncbi:Probable PE family protein [Mycobacteroides abscessus]|nr:Probable PE family protein [Mycobacteroides abscessus]